MTRTTPLRAGLGLAGLLLERVRLPEKFTPTAFTEDGIYGILTDDLGVQSPGRVR